MVPVGYYYPIQSSPETLMEPRERFWTVSRARIETDTVAAPQLIHNYTQGSNLAPVDGRASGRSNFGG